MEEDITVIADPTPGWLCTTIDARTDVSADGKRFLVITTGEAGTLPLTLVQNWRAELKR